MNLYGYFLFEMGSSYTWCNSCKVTPFLHCRFLKDLTVKKDTIKCYCFPPYYLINTSIFFLLIYCFPPNNIFFNTIFFFFEKPLSGEYY